MKVEGWLVVVDGEPFEDDYIGLGRGQMQPASMMKLYKSLEDAQTAKRSILGNGDGTNQVDLYKITLNLPINRTEPIKAKVKKV